MDVETQPDDLLAAFRSRLNRSLFRSLGNGIALLEEEFGDGYRADAARHLALLRAAHPDRPWPAWAVDGFIAFNRMILAEEAAFRETRAYSATPQDMERVTAEVYDSDAVMNGYYLVGLYLTYFVWPHHHRMLRFYRSAFLATAEPENGRFAEWGVGHGLLAAEALLRWPSAGAYLLDLSDHSLAFARCLLDAAGLGRRCTLVKGDVLRMDDLPPASRLVCSEVLEHVPDPGALLRRVRSSLVPGGLAFLTAAVNAPQSDHVFLYRSEAEVLAMVREAGLAVREHVSVVHPNRRGDAQPPSVVGLVAEAA
jgi:SAM-dependent methyltransferase